MSEELEALAKALDEARGQGNETIDGIHDAVTTFRDTVEPSEEDHDGFIDRLRGGVERLEASHPDLSAAIARVIDSLTAFGV